MKNTTLLFLLLFSSTVGLAQETYAIKPLLGMNTPFDELACSMDNGQLIVMTAQAPDLVNDYQWDEYPRYHLQSWQRGFDFSKWENPQPYYRGALNDVGPASYCADDSVLFFCSSNHFDGINCNHLKIYTAQWNGRRWLSPQALPLVDCSADFAHPHYVPSLRMLVFSSNRSGGMGGMDIWYMIRTETGWSEPFNLGPGVNSPANEVFPTFHQGDIYYSTNAADTWGGYDIRRANGTAQWRTAIAEGAPINSAADDVCVLFLSDDKAILTSNRAGGKGGDDLYLLSREAKPEEQHTMTALIECAGQPLAGVEVTVMNDAGEIVQVAPADAEGRIDISALRLNQTYSFLMNPGEGGSTSECLLVVKDPLGNRLTEVRFNVKGLATLELLPFRFSDAQALEIADESVLNLSFEGQLYQEKPGDIGRGEPITILNSAGDPIAIAYTNDVGRFRFTKLDPQLRYTMKLSPQTEATHAIITEKGEKIEIPVLNAELNYQRIEADEAITLVNEFNDTIHVSPRDLFVINRIYYDYNSAQLTGESRRQLEQLAIILERNGEIDLELRSHTDSRGEAAYNLKLSQQRAKSAVQYLIAKGIVSNRFYYEGLGETQLINECADGTQCSEPEHAINRRTEIRLKRRNSLAVSAK